MSDSTKGRKHRRSQGWFNGKGLDGYQHRSWMRNQGRLDDFFNCCRKYQPRRMLQR